MHLTRIFARIPYLSAFKSVCPPNFYTSSTGALSVYLLNFYMLITSAWHQFWSVFAHTSPCIIIWGKSGHSHRVNHAWARFGCVCFISMHIFRKIIRILHLAYVAMGHSHGVTHVWNVRDPHSNPTRGVDAFASYAYQFLEKFMHILHLALVNFTANCHGILARSHGNACAMLNVLGVALFLGSTVQGKCIQWMRMKSQFVER